MNLQMDFPIESRRDYFVTVTEFISCCNTVSYETVTRFSQLYNVTTGIIGSEQIIQILNFPSQIDRFIAWIPKM